MSDVAGFLVLIGRVLFAIFLAIISGYGFHLKNAKMAEGHPQSVGFPAPGIAAPGIAGGFGVYLIVASISSGATS